MYSRTNLVQTVLPHAVLSSGLRSNIPCDIVSMGATRCGILERTMALGTLAASPVFFPRLHGMLESHPEFQKLSYLKWDNRSQAVFRNITGWWQGTYTVSGGFCRQFLGGEGYLGCCADVPISFNTSLAIFATQQLKLPVMVGKLEGAFDSRQRSYLTIEISSIFCNHGSIMDGGLWILGFLPWEAHGTDTYRVGGEVLLRILDQHGDQTLQLSTAVFPWRSSETIGATLMPLGLGNCTPSSHWYLPMYNNAVQASHAFQVVFTMRRGRQALHEDSTSTKLLSGIPLFSEDPLTRRAAIPYETELPVVSTLQSTTEVASTFTATVGSSTSTATASLTASSLVEEHNANSSLLSASNASKAGSFIQLLVIVCIVSTCALGCGVYISIVRPGICNRMHNQPVEKAVIDFVNEARQQNACNDSNHSGSIFADGDPSRIAELGCNERWLLPAGSVVLVDSLMPNSERQHVQGILTRSIRCMITAVQIPEDTSVPYLELCNEIRIVRAARHPNIVLFFGFAPIYIQNIHYLGMIHEWIQGCTLEVYVAQRGQCNQSENQVTELQILLHVAEAMNFLHSMQCAFVHCDLRPHSVLIEKVVSPPRAKLFNFARAFQGDRVLELQGPPDGYVAPEVANAEPYTRASDIFSFGGICSYVLCGEHPSYGMFELGILPDTCGRAHDLGILPDAFGKASSAIGHVTKMCQRHNLVERPNFREVYDLLAQALQNQQCVNTETQLNGSMSGRLMTFLTTLFNLHRAHPGEAC